MALHRSSVSSRRGSKNDSQKDEDETENNGYIQVLVKPLEQGNFSLIFNWLGLTGTNVSSQHIGVVYGLALALSSVVLYYILKCDIGSVFHRLCGILVPMFTIICSFYWLSFYLRKTWSTTSVYLLFSSCFAGETIAQIFVNAWNSSYPMDESGGTERDITTVNHVTQPLVVFIVLLAVCTSSIFSSLETQYSAAVITLVSFTRFLACTTLGDLPQSFRPYISYFCGLVGIIVSKYMEAYFKPPVNNFMTQDGKIPVYKRRRSSASGTHAFTAHKNSTRRTSLPALIPKIQSSSASFESAILGEAHGLIDDMLADQSLPPHVVSGLRALGNLLKPPDNHAPFHKPRVSPLVSLTESTSYGSDTEENPYTGERPSTLPKKIRRSLPPSLIRRMSTSTWTTTTSATGMPTLEQEPCRIRSSSFRHSRDGTPGSSPMGSRSNSPSPSSPTVVLTIPKSRSFSLANPTPTATSHAKRQTRKSMGTSLAPSDSVVSSRVDSHFKHISPLAIDGNDSAEEGERIRGKEQQLSSFKRLNMTSDYESNDSPSSSDHSDNVMTSDDLVSGSPPKKSHISRGNTSLHSSTQKQRVLHESRLKDANHTDMAEDADEEDENDADADHRDARKSVVVKSDTKVDSVSADNLPWDIASIEDRELLTIHRLNDWDFPIFELADTCKTNILSKVAYKLFMEVGLFETFRIPVTPFLHYFHALELGYRDKPYHNRIHATDVLHGVYYLTTQPIPGFTQVTTSNMFLRNGSSSDSECDTTERSNLTHRANSFVAEDYGIMGGNFPALELMALYTASAMHDYDHPGRTNAFLVATNAPQAVLYNDRSVLENHHAAQAWSLFLSDPKYNFLCGLDPAEFKRFRFLVIENILATDLKRHFEILAEFNAKVNDEEAVGLDWTAETDRLLAMEMVIKLADINGPAKKFQLHHQWTERISEEFYEQGDEEMRRGMPISPYMDRRNPQLAKLQETFINHLVSPLCNAMVTAGLIPGTWVEEEESEDDEVSGNSDTDKADSVAKDTEDENDTDGELESLIAMKAKKKPRKVDCILTKNMKENHEWWVAKIQEEEKQKASAMEISEDKKQDNDTAEMEPIKEEVESQASSSSTPGTPTRDAPASPAKEPPSSLPTIKEPQSSKDSHPPTKDVISPSPTDKSQVT